MTCGSVSNRPLPPASRRSGGGSLADDIIRRSADVERRLSALARSLYATESSPELAFLRSQRDGGGATGRMAAELLRALDEIWIGYPFARDVGQQVVSAARATRWHEAEWLLRPDAIARPNGVRTGERELLIALQQQLDQMVEGAARLADRARQAIVGLDAATATFAALVERAATLGVEGDVEVREARKHLDLAVAAVATEPATELGGQLDTAIASLRQRIETLEEHRTALPLALADADVQLDEIRRLVARGNEARAEARQKILARVAEGLDPRGLDSGDRALQPWLTRIKGQAAAGSWQAAAAGLAQWQQPADKWLASASHIDATNRRPLIRRDELRGLLQASQARAAASGRIEEPDLVRLGLAAEEALYVAPCDLDRAEARVQAYVNALRSEPPGIQP